MTQGPSYAVLLERLAAEQRRYGSGPQPPCSSDEIERLAEHARAVLHTDLPADYLDFLRVTNGLDWNGVVVYASDTVPIVGHADRSIAGVVEMNVIYRDGGDFRHLLVLASDGMDVYTLNVANGLYEQYDDVPHELIETFVTFDDVMSQILARSQPVLPTED